MPQRFISHLRSHAAALESEEGRAGAGSARKHPCPQPPEKAQQLSDDRHQKRRRVERVFADVNRTSLSTHYTQDYGEVGLLLDKNSPL